MSDYKTNRKTRGKFRTKSLGSRYEIDRGPYKGLSNKEIGKAEAGTIDISLPFPERLIAEVMQYNLRYGPASWGDITLEYNSRGKDFETQGAVYRYAYTNIDEVRDELERLVAAGRLRKVEVPGALPGYVAPESGEEY